MMRWALAGISFLFFGIAMVSAQETVPGRPWSAENGGVSADTAAVDYWLKSALYYIKKPGEDKQDLDSAADLIMKATPVMSRLKDMRCEGYLAYVNGCLYHEKKQLPQARQYEEMAVEYLSLSKGNYLLLGDSYYEMGDIIRDQGDAYMEDRLRAMGSAAHFYEVGGYEDLAGKSYCDIGMIYRRHSKLDTAAVILSRARELYLHTHNEDIYIVDWYLATAYMFRGNIASGLTYFLEGEKYTGKSTRTIWLDAYYYDLAQTYFLMHDGPLTDYWAKRGLELCSASYIPGSFYGYVELRVKVLVEAGKPKDAMDLLQGSIKEVKPDTTNRAQQRLIASMFGLCYTAMKDYKNAERNFHLMDSLFRSNEEELKGTGFSPFYNDLNHYMVMANFNYKASNYKMVNVFLQKFDSVLKRDTDNVTPFQMGNYDILRYKVDSVQGNFLSAIHYFEASKKIRDSIFAVGNSEQMSELNARYKADSSAKAIVLLRSVKDRQGMDLQKINVQRNFILTGSFLLLVIAGLSFRSYRIKRRGSLELEQKQQEISRQKLVLEGLVEEKDKLLDEKEALLEVKDVLMREIHHRVKNNLHMISSLLESQSAYLQDEALLAVQKSQHRVQAISLIHHKLYMNPSVTKLDMSVYLREMVTYLRESFISEGSILFDMELDPVELDVSQAVPVGLIVNEAVTNAIKYAFKGREAGIIYVSLKELQDGECLLIVADNGSGIPQGLNTGVSKSLGMSLIRGFARSLRAELTIFSEAAVRIELRFRNKSTSTII